MDRRSWRLLGPSDEPDAPGSVVAVNFGDYRTQEVWVSSGSNIKNWFCLGGEYGRPKVWDDPRTEMQKHMWGPKDGPPPRPGPNEIPRYPVWRDVLARGPVVLLSPGDGHTYATAWVAGRLRMVEQMESVSLDGPSENG